MNNIQKIVATIIVMVLMVSVSAANTSNVSADASSLLIKPFGGVIISFIPPTPTCLIAHTLIYDFASGTSFGIATSFNTTVYDYGNLYLPSAYVLGTAERIPLPCAVPYAIYPIISVGTSLF